MEIMQDHISNLQCLCRLCGNLNTGDREGKKQIFQREILSAYELDVTNDKHYVHPSLICSICLKKLYRVRKALDEGREYCPEDTSVYLFEEHGENCAVCLRAESPAPAQRGRPKKKKGGKVKSSRSVTPKPPMSTSEQTDNFESFQDELYNLPLKSVPYNWGITKSKDYVILTQVNGVPIPMISRSITITKDNFRVFVHNQPLPEDHELYTTRSSKITDLHQLQQILDDMEQYSICNGNPDDAFVHMFSNKEPQAHKLGYKEEISEYRNHDGTEHTATVRTKTCRFLTFKLRCTPCIEYRNTLRAMSSKHASNTDPTSTKDMSKVNYRYMSNASLIDSLKKAKQMTASAEEEINRLRKLLDDKINTEGVELDSQVSTELTSVLSNGSPFPEDSLKHLFWEQQVKASSLQNPRSVRWHPTVIKWCLNLNAISTKAYKTVSESGALKLPSLKTLQDYSHYIKVRAGYQPEVMAQCKEQAVQKGVFDEEKDFRRYTVVLLDEMKIKKDLVYDKHSGELTGFTHLGDINEELNIAGGQGLTKNRMASHMMAVMIRSICGKFKFQLSHYPVTNAAAGDLFPIVWEVIDHLEKRGFKVLAVTCDGASINRRLFKMHRPEGTRYDYLTYSTPNIFAKDDRPLFFIADPPHLLKTTRNCWSNSYSHKLSRKLWNDGYDISWMHLVELYKRELAEDRSLRMACKLKAEHINLTSFSLMRVRLAAQVLSSSVAKAMEVTGGPNVAGTVKFISMMDKWFDCMNVRSYFEGIRKKNDYCKPYCSIDDERFQFLCGEFEDYLNSWERSVASRPGNFTPGERKQMMLSRETIEGLRITTRAFVGTAKHLLAAGAHEVLSEHLCQDLLEQEFSKHRHHGGASANPTANVFNNQAASLRVQSGFGSASRSGNTTVEAGTSYEIDNTPLRKRPRTKKN